MLDRDDIAAGKTECLFTRAESRDFIDVHALVVGGHYTTYQLLALASERDTGFDRAVFADMLAKHRRFGNDEFHRYGLTDDGISELRTFYNQWRANLTASQDSESSHRAMRLRTSSQGEPPAPKNDPEL